jgi:hypothetical protein
MVDDIESYEYMKNLLGDMGIEILLAIDKGAKNYETIQLFSGLPISCVRGRVPVLLDLKLIKKIKEDHFITEKGIKFKKKLNNQF